MHGPYRENYIERLSVDSERAPGGIMAYYADGDEEIIHVNQYVIDLCECESIDDFLELTQGSFRGFVNAEDVEAAEDSIWGQVDEHDNFDHLYYRVKTKTGKLVSVEDFGRLEERDGQRPVFHVFIAEMSAGHSVDWLTGLPDIARFNKLSRLAVNTMAKRGEKPAVAALDLVGLKAFNAEYGRDEGDKLLQVFADVLRRHFGSEACSRFAEDHYYAFAPESELQNRIEAVFEDFRTANDGRVLPVRCGAYACEAGEDIIEIGTDRAKIACDRDRKTWKSHLIWFNDELREEERLRIYVLEHVERAIKERWIRPHYQAIVRAATSDLCGEEALARWVDPTYGMLSPAQFIPVLEEAGLQYRVDMHIVDCVIADMVVKREHGVHIVPVSINLSQRDLAQIDIADEIARKADAAGIPRRYLNVEVTESVVSNDINLLKSQISALHEAGFEVWMDDFGSGYSSLNVLQKLDFDVVKLDMQFVSSLEDSEKSRTIIEGIMKTIAQLGVNTLAEGVETEQQARFLESIGCNMLQGYFHSHPITLEEVVDRFEAGHGRHRELPDEAAYWSTIGRLDLIDSASSLDSQRAKTELTTEYPVGVYEYRDDSWRIIRANMPFRSFLDDVGIMPMSASPLKVFSVGPAPEKEFQAAADRCLETDAWEMIAGALEDNSGFRFYIRTVASTAGANAFLVAGVPTMLGAALGAYGDVPAAYAVFRVDVEEGSHEVKASRFIFANTMYCDWVGFERAELVGKTLEMDLPGASPLWYPYSYRAAVLGEFVQDIVYSPEVDHWLNISVAPSPINGCCSYAFSIADDERRERQEMIKGRDTSDHIIDITNALSREGDYETAMNDALEAMSKVVKAEHLYLFEQNGNKTDWVFEWCAEGIKPRLGMLRFLRNLDLSTWLGPFASQEVLAIPDISALPDDRHGIRERLKSVGIENTLTAPLHYMGKTVGYFAADNYKLDDEIDIVRLLKTVSTFIGARIANNRLLEELELAGTHDSLTGLLNRRGVDAAIAEHLAANPGEAFVLALLDIDDFKLANDLHGHAVGDEALRALSRYMRKSLPEGSILGRNGGDELLIMLTGENVAHADEIFQEFTCSEKPYECEGKRYGLSVSLGYAGYPDDADTLASVYTKADAALYSVKLAGKAGCRRFSTDLQTQYRSQLGFTPRDIAENIPGGIMVHSVEGAGEVLFANDELIEMLECDGLADFMDYTNGTFLGIAHPEDIDRVYADLAQQVNLDAVGDKCFADYRILTKKGNVRHVAASGRLVEIENVGKAFYTLVLDRDERMHLLGD